MLFLRVRTLNYPSSLLEMSPSAFFPGTCASGFSSVAQSCLTLCNPLGCSTPGFPVLHHLPEFAQSWWCHPPISSSVSLFYSCPQSFPASGSFPISWLFASGGQSFGVSASVLPMNIQGWFPLGLTDLISLLYKGLSRVFSGTTVWRHQFFRAQPFLWSSSHICTGRTITWTIWIFVSKVVSLLFKSLLTTSSHFLVILNNQSSMEHVT